MIRLFVAEDLAAGRRVPLAPDPSRYLLTVMRQGVGDALLLFNGRHGEWRARIVEAGKRGAVLEAESLARAQGVGPDLELVIALVKRTRLETVIEKAAELGVHRVRLALTRRTNVEGAKLARLQAIAIEASEQTGRMEVPEILPPERLDRILDAWDAGRRLVFCDEAGEAPPMLQAVTALGRGPAAVLIGPEGGFDPAERSRLRGAAFTTPASLGPRILRADTAAISALTLWQAAVGDWGSCPATAPVPNEPGPDEPRAGQAPTA